MINPNHQVIDDLKQILTVLKLRVCLDQFQAIAERCEKEKASYIEFLHELVLRETEQRQQKRIAALIKYAQLPRNKLLSDFDMARIPGARSQPGLESCHRRFH